MSANFFAGSQAGEAGRLPADARLECKICWYVYDPAEGDEVWQVPAGTPFSELPEYWACPECDGERSGFMLLDEETA